MRCLVTRSGKAASIQGSTKCPGGFHKHRDSCYWFSNKKGTFDEAMSRCNHLGADLASITSREEEDFIKEYATLSRTGV
ncbi:perlucin-like [Haliotis rufescens]|uniref:perlucin-like n=1 Tax=Haliotis rufescens TaxID=6454 RepID=UPI00201F8ADE|nr:perlucin-like [Haliotis rufescens]